MAIKKDLQLALTRCWSGGDSNRRSHPTESLCLSLYCTRKTGPAVRSAALVERREFEPPVPFHARLRSRIHQRSWLNSEFAVAKQVCSNATKNQTFSRMRPRVRIPSAPATRQCEPEVPFRCAHQGRGSG